jgi:hypothetical protein
VKLAGYRPTRILILAMVAAAFLLEPMYHTLYLGQVNLFLLALVLADISRVSRGRPATGRPQRVTPVLDSALR